MNGTPASSQIIWLENKVKEQADEIDRLRHNLKAELLDHINGTPCAQIRWHHEKEDLEKEIERLREALRKIENIGDCGCQSECGDMIAIALAALKGDE